MRLVSKIEAKFHFLIPTVKFRGGVDENAEWDDRVHPTAEPPV